MSDIPRRGSHAFGELVQKEASRRYVVRLRDWADGVITDGMVLGDKRLSREETIGLVMQNVALGIMDVKQVVAPTMAKHEMAQFREASRGLVDG